MFEVNVTWNEGDTSEVSYTNTETQAWNAVSIALKKGAMKQLLDVFKCVSK